MNTLTLSRETKISGTFENVKVKGELKNDPGDQFVTIVLSEDVKSELGKNDWRAGDTVHVHRELIESIN